MRFRFSARPSGFRGCRTGSPRGGVRAAFAALLACAAVLSSAEPAAAQSRVPDASGCRVAADGTLECDTIVVEGTLRNIVMITFSREGLGIKLLELRQSFVRDIVESVDGEPF